MAKRTKPATEAPALDLSALSIETAELSPIRRQRKHRDNPFVGAMAESWNSGTARAVTVPDANVTEVVYLIRRAADEIDVRDEDGNEARAGVRVEKVENGNGSTTVKFQAVPRRKYNRKDEDEAAPESA
jgi:hypothetical protein